MEYVNCHICKKEIESGNYCKECWSKIKSGNYGLKICPKCKKVKEIIKKGKIEEGEKCNYCLIMEKYTITFNPKEADNDW